MFGGRKKQLERDSEEIGRLGTLLDTAEDEMTAAGDGILGTAASLSEADETLSGISTALTALLAGIRNDDRTIAHLREEAEAEADAENAEHLIAAHASEEWESIRDAVNTVMENGRHSTDVAKAMLTGIESLTGAVQALQETADQLGAMGRNMGVLALNSAIEAGRLGPEAVKYVKAAEEVRVNAEGYTSAAGTVSDGLAGLKETCNALSDAVNRAIALMKNTSKGLVRLSEQAEENRKFIEEHAPDRSGFSARDIADDIAGIADASENHGAAAESSVSAIGEIRSSLSGERSGLNDAHDRLRAAAERIAEEKN